MKKLTSQKQRDVQDPEDGILITSAKVIGSALGGLAARIGMADAPPTPPSKKATVKRKRKPPASATGNKSAKVAPRRLLKKVTAPRKKKT